MRRHRSNDALEQLAEQVADVQRTLLANHPQLQPGSGPRVGIRRISTGLGCPHAENRSGLPGPDNGLPNRRRPACRFITINHGGAPTDTPGEFIALLKGPADAAGGDHASDLLNLFSSQARLLAGLVRHAGTRAPAIATQVIRQTLCDGTNTGGSPCDGLITDVSLTTYPAYTDYRLLERAGVSVIQTPFRAPNCNAHAERFVRSN